MPRITVRASVGLFWLYSRKMEQDCSRKADFNLSGGNPRFGSETVVRPRTKVLVDELGQIFRKLWRPVCG